MSCSKKHLIVRLVGRELSEPDEHSVRQHLAACDVCATAYKELSETWDDLGSWHIDLASTDLTKRVLEQSMNRDLPIRRHLLVSLFSAGQMRLAASIALAAGLGIATGAIVPTGQAGKESMSSPKPTAIELTESLGLVELSTESATGLPWGFDSEFPTDAEVGS